LTARLNSPTSVPERPRAAAIFVTGPIHRQVFRILLRSTSSIGTKGYAPSKLTMPPIASGWSAAQRLRVPRHTTSRRAQAAAFRWPEECP
jgi:hypothetical protein